MLGQCYILAIFQSTLPARGATRAGSFPSFLMVFQSTLPARGATRPFQKQPMHQLISIHAPRTGSDSNPLPRKNRAVTISIHAPRTGSDLLMVELIDVI